MATIRKRRKKDGSFSYLVQIRIVCKHLFFSGTTGHWLMKALTISE